ncbi:MAG TPA: hypothetical protein VFQ13_00020 [Anaerolineales bacterium]|nr:hypothetical protein [Anaerolineales bacterium]
MRRLCFVALLFVLLALPSNARADVAPPLYPPGSNPQPGVEVTQVRMVAETVIIEVLKDIEPRSLGDAHVTADFTMHNLGTIDESMAARFPISVNDGRWEYPEINNLLIQVNGKQVQHRRVTYPDYRYSDDSVKKNNAEMLPWAEFDITFPAGQDVSIRVTYDLEGTGYYPATVFYYVLETGASWKESIGSADIILRLPYEANPQNVMDQETGWGGTTPGGVFQGNEVRWHFEDLEPTGWEYNMEFALIAPSAWETVLSAQKQVAKYPNDGESWGMLAKAYKLAFLSVKGYREDEGGQQLYQLSLEAYEKCLSLKPNDAQWHAGFADLLAYRAMWDVMGGTTTPEAIRALNEIHTALELAPNDTVVQEIAYSMTSLLYGGIIQNGDRYDFPWLTQTPTALPPTLEVIISTESAATLPATPAPTKEHISQVEPTRAEAPEATPTSAPQRSSPICGSAAFLPLIALTWFAWKRR